MQVQKLREGIFIIEGFMLPEECSYYVSTGEDLTYKEATVDTGKGHMMIKGVRNNDRVLYENKQLASEIWEKIKHFAPVIGNSEPIGLNELFRFYRYIPGQRFKAHREGSYIRNEKEASFYTLLIYLNEGYKGGETRFDNGITVEGSQGMALIFLHSLKHEGCVVTEGTKYVLRTDIMYRTP